MTTTISITTHDWPVEVTTYDEVGEGVHTQKQRVEPNSNQSLAIWDTRSFHIRELPRE